MMRATGICWIHHQHEKFGGLEPWNFMTLHILGMSLSQLTFTPSFFRGVGGSTTNQKNVGDEAHQSLYIPPFFVGSCLIGTFTHL